VALVGEERFARIEQLSIELYRTAADYALERGIIIADTKFEFGEDADGRIVVGDEVLTPDSSRFWPVDEYAPGGSPPSYDKQYVRNWLETLDWDKTPPGPEIPADVVAGTRARYVEAYERLTGEPFQAYLDATGRGS
jgi:phosphoribosylaminoimidazole-succinocarboxamide synthase